MPWHFSNWYNFYNFSNNSSPTAVSDFYNVSEDSVLTFNVMSNDYDYNNDSFTVYTVNGSVIAVGDTISLASGALVTYLGGGSFSYDSVGVHDGLDNGETETDVFQYQLRDSRGALSSTAQVSVTVTGTNDAPVATIATAVAFEEEFVNAAPQVLDSDVSFTDAEGNLDGGALTVSGLLPEDQISIRHQGTGAGEIGVSGQDVTYAGVVIGTFTGGAGTTLTVVFNAAATAEAVDALIQNLTYANSSDAPTEERTLIINVTDAAGADLGLASTTGVFSDAATNPFSGVDVGWNAIPTFIDIDGDGDLDLVVGEYYGTLKTFRNDNGSYTELTGAANPLGAIDTLYYSAPAAVDIDGDGDQDLVVGKGLGEFLTVRNNGDGTFTELTGTDNPLNGIDADYLVRPTFGDIDADGDLDMVVGNGEGFIRTYLNDGAGSFVEQTGAANPFDGVDVGFYAAPALVDLDGDGDLDLVVGDEMSNELRTFRNNGSGTFSELTGTSNPFDGVDVDYNATPAFVDLDGDGDLDLVTGEYSGGLLVFENDQPRGHAIIVTVTPQDDARNAADDLTGTDEASIATGNVLANDNDPDAGPTETVSAVNGDTAAVGTQIILASGALLTLNADGSYSYDPNGVFDNLVEPGLGASNESATDSFTYTLSGGDTATVTVTITGITNLSDTIIGTDELDTIIGTNGADRIDGGAGGDNMAGGAGNDTYVVNNPLDQITELEGGGRDTVESSADYTLPDRVEELILTGTGNLNGTGNDRANTIRGNAGNNIIDGGFGIDTMIGGAGDDTYVVNQSYDVIVENENEGTDTVVSWVHYTLGDNIENLILAGTAMLGTGNAGANTITGNALGNVLDGGAGADVLKGRGGDDYYIVDDAGDVVDEWFGEGNDTVQASVSYTIGKNVENLTLTGTADIDGTGNNGNNLIIGNSGANRIDGGIGADVMKGRGGDDTYVVDNAGDLVDERSGEGIDTVLSSVSYTLANNVENLTLTGGSVANGTGNFLANMITGNGAANVLKGMAGTDTIDGGAGNDKIYGGTERDTLTGGEGQDSFHFDAFNWAHADHITDFSSADDAIALDRSVFTEVNAGTLFATAFVEGTAAGDADDRIVYNKATGEIFYDADGSGSGAQVLFATVAPETILSHADFIGV